MTTTSTGYDLILTGGTLLDPGQGIHGRRDVAFKDGLVAAVAERIEAEPDVTVIDVTGKLITPGLIDLHGHFYHGGNGSAVHPDQNCLSAGATTGVDAGSAGFLNYQAMRDYVFRDGSLAGLRSSTSALHSQSVLGIGISVPSAFWKLLHTRRPRGPYPSSIDTSSLRLASIL